MNSLRPAKIFNLFPLYFAASRVYNGFVQSPIPTSEAPCPKCKGYNAPTVAACAMCGARLPWADALQTQLAQTRAVQAKQEKFIKEQNRRATLRQADQTINNVADWMLPVGGVVVVVIVVGSILVAGAQGGVVVVPIGLIARVLLRSWWNDR